MKDSPKFSFLYTLPIATFLMVAVFSIGGIACNVRSETQQGEQTNDKRWENYQKDNKSALSQAQASYEKRQAELAEKRRKADAGKKDDEKKPATAAAPTAPAPSTTP